MTTLPFFTIGHSTRTLEEFTDLLETHDIRLVVDVRKLAGSARFPQFDADTLGAHLATRGIELRRIEALTGRRGVSHTVPFEVNSWWHNRSFHNYADHALSAEFRDGLAQLREWGHATPSALMCAEAVWWRCHRRIISDHLIAHEETVLHIMGPGDAKPAELSAGAQIDAAHRVTYPEE